MKDKVIKFKDFRELPADASPEEFDREAVASVGSTDNIIVPDVVGSTLACPKDPQLRRRKVQYTTEGSELEEAGPFSYGRKPPRKGSLAWEIEKRRKEQEKNKHPIEPKDQMVGTAKSIKYTTEDIILEITDKLVSKYDDLEEDVHSADYKISQLTGKKYRAKHITFDASRDDGTLANSDTDERTGEPVVKKVRNKPLLKKVAEEVEDEVEDEVTDEDISEDELEDMANEIDDEDDILDEYDEDELIIVDEDSGEVIEEQLEEAEQAQLNEVLSRAERMRAKIRFARTRAKRGHKLKLALKRKSNTATLNRRARKLAVKMLKKRLARKDPSKMSVSEKERVERLIKTRKKLVDRLAMRLVPKIRKIEQTRLSHKHTK